MKKLKFLSLILAVLMLLPLVLTACRGDSPTIPGGSSEVPSDSGIESGSELESESESEKQVEILSAEFIGQKLQLTTTGDPLVYELFSYNINSLTRKEKIALFFETIANIETIAWEVYSVEEYPDLSYVVLISGTNSKMVYYIPQEDDNVLSDETSVETCPEGIKFNDFLKMKCMIVSDTFWDVDKYSNYINTLSTKNNWGNYYVSSNQNQLTVEHYPAGPKINLFEVPNISVGEWGIYSVTLELGTNLTNYIHPNNDRITIVLTPGKDTDLRIVINMCHFYQENVALHYIKENPDAHLIDEELNMYFSVGPENVPTYSILLSERYLASITLYKHNEPIAKEYHLMPDIIETLVPMLEKLMYDDAK